MLADGGSGMRETVPCQICGRELTNHDAVTHVFLPSRSSYPPPGPPDVDWSAVALWVRICKLALEWRAETDPRRATCSKTLACLRPHQHDGECWPKEGKPRP